MSPTFFLEDTAAGKGDRPWFCTIDLLYLSRKESTLTVFCCAHQSSSKLIAFLLGVFGSGFAPGISDGRRLNSGEADDRHVGPRETRYSVANAHAIASWTVRTRKKGSTAAGTTVN